MLGPAVKAPSSGVCIDPHVRQRPASVHRSFPTSGQQFACSGCIGAGQSYIQIRKGIACGAAAGVLLRADDDLAPAGIDSRHHVGELRKTAGQKSTIDEQVNGATNYRQLDAILQANKRTLSQGELVLLCNQLAKVTDSNKWSMRTCGQTQVVMTELLNRLKPHMANMTHLEFIAVIAALAKVKYSPTEEEVTQFFKWSKPHLTDVGPGHLMVYLRSIAALECDGFDICELDSWQPWLSGVMEQALIKLPAFRPDQLVNCLWALGSMKARVPASFMDQVVSHLDAVIPVMDGCQLSNLLLSCSLLHYTPDKAFVKKALGQLFISLPLLDDRELSTTCQALAQLRDRAAIRPDLLARVMVEVQGKLGSFRAVQLANLLGALGTLGAAPPDVWLDQVAGVVQSIMWELPPNSFVAAAYGLMQMKYKGSPTYPLLLVQSAIGKLPTMGPTYLARLLLVLAHYPYQGPPKTWKSFVVEVKRYGAIKPYKGREVCEMVYALARLPSFTNPDVLITTLLSWSRVYNLRTNPPSNIARLLWGLKQLNFVPDYGFVYLLMQVVRSFWTLFKPCEYAEVLAGVAWLQRHHNIPDKLLWSELLVVVQCRLGEMRPADLAAVMTAVMTAVKQPGGPPLPSDTWLTSLIQASLSQLTSFSPPDLLAMTKALQQLPPHTTETWREAVRKLLESSAATTNAASPPAPSHDSSPAPFSSLPSPSSLPSQPADALPSASASYSPSLLGEASWEHRDNDAASSPPADESSDPGPQSLLVTGLSQQEPYNRSNSTDTIVTDNTSANAIGTDSTSVGSSTTSSTLAINSINNGTAFSDVNDTWHAADAGAGVDTTMACDTAAVSITTAAAAAAASAIVAGQTTAPESKGTPVTKRPYTVREQQVVLTAKPARPSPSPSLASPDPSTTPANTTTATSIDGQMPVPPPPAATPAPQRPALVPPSSSLLSYPSRAATRSAANASPLKAPPVAPASSSLSSPSSSLSTEGLLSVQSAGGVAPWGDASGSRQEAGEKPGLNDLSISQLTQILDNWGARQSGEESVASTGRKTTHGKVQGIKQAPDSDVIRDVKSQVRGAHVNGVKVNGAHVNGTHVNGVKVNGVHVGAMNSKSGVGIVSHVMDGSGVVRDALRGSQKKSGEMLVRPVGVRLFQERLSPKLLRRKNARHAAWGVNAKQEALGNDSAPDVKMGTSTGSNDKVGVSADSKIQQTKGGKGVVGAVVAKQPKAKGNAGVGIARQDKGKIMPGQRVSRSDS